MDYGKAALNKIGNISEVGSIPRNLSKTISERGVSVKDFGAKGDWNGTTGADDTTAIQNAINSIPQGGTVHIPKGNYKITSDLIIPNGIVLQGQGRSGTTIEYYGATSAIKFGKAVSNITMKDLLIKRKGATKDGTIGIFFQANMFCEIHNVRTEDFGTGFRVDGLDTWCASNWFYGIQTLRCMTGVLITSDAGKQSNHNVFVGGYINGSIPVVTGSKGVVIETGDSNKFFGTAVEDLDIGYHFISLNPGGNSAISPRAEGCNINYLIDNNTLNTILIDPFGDGITNNSRNSLILTRTPTFRGENIIWSNGTGIKFYDSGYVLREVMSVDSSNNMYFKMPSVASNKTFTFQLPDTGGTIRDELQITSDLVKTRRYLQAGNITSLPAADSSMRGRMVRVEGGSGVADGLYICMKNADGTYTWKTITLT